MSATVRTALELAHRLQAQHGYTAAEAAEAVAQRAGALYAASARDVEAQILSDAPPARRVSPETQARIDRHNAKVVQSPPWKAEMAQDTL
jgi:hypothetical protein